MSRTWFTADLHINHANLVSCTTDWTDLRQCRVFDTMEAHNQSIIDSINKYVAEDDVLYILGDILFGDKNYLTEFRLKLNCKTIHYIYGNHCDYIIENKVLDFRGTKVPAQSVFDTVQFYKEIKLSGRRTLSLSHYPFDSWRDSHKSHKIGYMFHGHVHGNLHDVRKNRRIDVGWDSSYLYFNEYRPFELNEALELSIINNIPEITNETGRITNSI